jgi:hypothetical protein
MELLATEDRSIGGREMQVVKKSVSADRGGEVNATSLAGASLVLAGVVGVVVGLATSIFYPALVQSGSGAFGLGGVILTLHHLLVMAGVAALARSNVGGSGWFSKSAFLVAILGFCLQSVAEAALRINFSFGNVLFGIAAPAIAVGMILVGIAIYRERAWSGWHRYAALACGLYVPAVLIPSFALANGLSLLALTGWSVCYLALGLAAREETSLRSITTGIGK